MTRFRFSPVAPLVFLLITLACGGETTLSEDDPIDAVLADIDPDAIQAHVTFLADDRLAGRRTGTPGYALAADYVGEQFAEIGLHPVEDDGSYLGRVGLRRKEGRRHLKAETVRWNEYSGAVTAILGEV
jgi:hypothetical protein